MKFIETDSAAYAIRCKATDLANWRRGAAEPSFPTSLGQKRGKTILYSFEEVVLVAIAARLARSTLTLEQAFEIVREHRDRIESDARRAIVDPDWSSVLIVDLNLVLSTGYRGVQLISGPKLETLKLPLEAYDEDDFGRLTLIISNIARGVRRRLTALEDLAQEKGETIAYVARSLARS